METIRYSIQDFFNTCKGKVLSYWARRKKSQRLHIHYIVAKTDGRAADTRILLEDAGIRVLTDDRNLVLLKGRFHERLHTQAFFDCVNACFAGKRGKDVQVINTLFALKTILAIINTEA